METLEQRINALPLELRREVEDFVDFLVERRTPKSSRPLRQDWAGPLSDYRDTYTSLDLQKKAIDWRLEELESRGD